MNTSLRFLAGVRSRQRGAALVVALVLLMILTVLGISGMTTATLQLTMAGNAQFHQQAFQAAETGLAIAISGGRFGAAIGGADIVLPRTPLGDGGIDFTSLLPDQTRMRSGSYLTISSKTTRTR